MGDLNKINMADAARVLDLAVDQWGRVEVPFMGKTFFLGSSGAHLKDGREAPANYGTILAGYLIHQGSGEPAGEFIPLDHMKGLGAAQNSHAYRAMEKRIARCAEKDLTRFHEAIEECGGRLGGEVGSGGKSWIIHPLPKIAVQVVFYMGDEEFPSDARLLFDVSSVNFLEYESLAVLATIFVDELVNRFEDG